jgi:hypothetical protein
MTWDRESTLAYAPWSPAEWLQALDEQIHDPSEDEENPCWWVLSALESFEGKEARETYYAKL